VLFSRTKTASFGPRERQVCGRAQLLIDDKLHLRQSLQQFSC